MHFGHGGNNSERWLVSYADFLTLLFAFFVVMFATAQTDKQKARKVSDSVRKAYGSTKPTPTEAESVPMMMGTPITKAPAQNPLVANMITELQESLESLSKELDAEIRSGKIRIKMEARGLVISLQDNALFARGSDEIQPSIRSSVDRIADAIRKLGNPVRLEGHTDSTPIRNERFRNNWDLSVARALSALDYLTETTNLPISRFAVAGYGDSVPVASNDSEDGRARNRRVDVVIMNQYTVQ
jgi:chemotaxis protein MotB